MSEVTVGDGLSSQEAKLMQVIIAVCSLPRLQTINFDSV